MRRACRYLLLYILPIIVGAPLLFAANTYPPALNLEEYGGLLQAYKAASYLPESAPKIVGSPEIHKPAETTIFEDGFESGLAGWTVDEGSNWKAGVPTNEYGPSSAYSGNNVAASGLDTLYTQYTTTGGLTSPSITIPEGFDVIRMEFKLWYKLYYDNFYVELSQDNGVTWNMVLPTDVFTYGYLYYDYEGSTYQKTTRGAWNNVVCDLTSYAGQDVLIRFRLYAGYGSYNYEPGLFIDEVKVAGYEQGEPLVAIMPTYYTWPGEEAVLWGSVTPDNEIGSFVNSSYRWDFGDGSDPVTGTVTDPNYVMEKHIYTIAGSKTATLTIDPTGTNNFAAGSSRTVKINVSVDNLETRRLKAIEDGLRWLYTQALTNGHIGADTYWVGETGLAILAFEEQGHHAGSSILTDIYSPVVKKGLDAIIGNAKKFVFADYTQRSHPGDPDTNGNGYGYYLGYDAGATKYTTGVCMLTIIASRTPDEIITSGAAAGDTYRELIQDICDYYSFVQSDTTAYSTRGGWQYNVDYSGSADNSATQWPALGMMAAEQEWGCTVHSWVKDELRYWLDYSQADNGGYTYTGPGNSIGMTGAALCQWAFVGEKASKDEVALALNFLNEYWDYRDGRYGHFNGNFYSLYAVAKGLRVMRYADGSQVNLIGQHNWWNEYVDHLVNDETYKQGVGGDTDFYDGKWRYGYWNGGGFSFNVPTMQNSLAILVLSPGVFELPPVAAITGPDGAQPNVDVSFSGANSYHQDPQKSVVEWLWDFDASDGVDWDNPDAVGTNVVVSGGWNIQADADTIIVTLRVKDNSQMTMYDTEEHKIIIGNINHAPIAVAGGPYASQPGEPIQLDGTGSYDPDPGDSIVSYEWDLDGDGEYDDSTEPNPTITWNDVREGLVGLRVWDSDGLSSSDETPVYVSIWTSERDIAISQSGLQISSEMPSEGETVSLSVSGSYVTNDGEPVESFKVRFYNGNPDSSFILIGDYTVENLASGQSFTATMNWNVPAEFKSTVWVKIDSMDEVNEYDETNNSDHLYIGGSDGPKVVQLYCDPDPAKIITSGAIPSIVSVSIRNVTGLFGTEIVMNFDQTKVNVVSIDPGAFFSKDMDAPSDFSSIDNENGTLTISLTRLGGNDISGSGSIADVKFVGMGVDPASLLTFESIKLRDSSNAEIEYESSDDGAFEGITSLLGDFDSNMTVDFVDYTQLIVYWNAGNTLGDIVGAAEGSAGSPPWAKDSYPFAPDGVIDFEDQIVFALMYNWYLEVTSDGVGVSKPSGLVASKPPVDFETGLTSSIEDFAFGETFSVALNPGSVDDFLGAEMVLGFDPSILRVNSVTTSLAEDIDGIKAPVEYRTTKNGLVASTVVLGNVPERVALGADTLFEIEFEIIGEGVFGITLDRLDMRDSRNNASMPELTSRVISGKVGTPIELIPLAFGLEPNYPNPFNMSTTIGYSLDAAGMLEMKIYNTIGQEVKTLVSDYMTPGRQQVMWDGTNNHGDIVTSGVYFVRLRQGSRIQTSQLLLIK